MNAYSLALFLHLLFVLVACAAASLTTFAAVRLRRASSPAEALEGMTLIGRIVRAFPVSVLGLLATGAYMTRAGWGWSTPWIDAALVALGIIVALGPGVEARRAEMLRREIESAGLSSRARRLMSDPVAWSAKMTTLTLVVAVVFLMTVKPHAVESAASIVVAVVAGVLGAVPIWRSAGAQATEVMGRASS